MRRLLFVLLLLTAMTAGPAVSADAALQWYKCTILQAGPHMEGSTHEMRFQIELPKQTRWFKAASGFEKEMLAVALAALSNGKQVRILADLLEASVPVIRDMYFVN